MKKKITFLVLSDTDACSRQLSLSRNTLVLFSLVALLCIIAMPCFLYDYLKLKQSSSYCQALERKVSSQKKELVDQRRQIQNFADQINVLKSSLLVLNGLEEKVRSIAASIEKSSPQVKFQGMGGSMPEDIDTRIPLQQKHDSLVREMHEQMKQLNLVSVKQQDEFELLLKDLKHQQNLLASKPTIRPAAGWISSRFGYRQSPFSGRRELHKGIDIANRKGTPILATADGTVTFAGRRGSLGNLVVIDHGHGIVTRYAHMNKVLAQRGSRIRRGAVIGKMGNTGRSTGSHLHYEVLLNGLPVNPMKYILN